MRRLWTPFEDQQLRDGIDEGATHAELAEELGRTPDAIERRCRALGIRGRRGQPVAYHKRAAILDLLRQGKTISEIARIRGVNRSVAWAMVRRMYLAGMLQRRGGVSWTVRYTPRRENACDE